MSYTDFERLEQQRPAPAERRVQLTDIALQLLTSAVSVVKEIADLPKTRPFDSGQAMAEYHQDAVDYLSKKPVTPSPVQAESVQPASVASSDQLDEAAILSGIDDIHREYEQKQGQSLSENPLNGVL